MIGASSGIGQALAELGAKRGLDVVASARRREPLEQMAESYSNLTALPLDVSDPASVSAAVDTLGVDNFPELIVFCAGTYVPGGLEVLNYESAEHHFKVNYLGAVATLDAIVPVLKKRARGHVAIVSSLTAYRGLPKAAVYGPTKAALLSLCETIKPDFDKLGLDLSVVNPGFVRTPMTDKNEFKMPFLMETEEAAEATLDGLAKKQFEVTFPAPLVRRLRFLRLLPYSLYFKAIGRISQ
ncbi:SDR family NAD(P)-dependent oxidoreductase [Pseudovibrio flavus]|uniref:SDR family NAD(P)-dependent oxidoreductase n=1 Tax=Pseudovibrio flavus TaxID=2529854 RepID=UPI0035275E5B